MAITALSDVEHPVNGKSPKRLNFHPISFPALSTSAIDDSNVNENTVLSTVPKTENIIYSRICSKGGVKGKRLDGTDKQNRKGLEDLLDKDSLDKLCSTEGRTSTYLLEECDKICSFIKGKSNDILHVKPAYKIDDETAVTFVVFACKNISLGELPWVIKIRILDQHYDKSKVLLRSEKNQPLSTEIARRISSAIDNHSEDLMKKHKFLSGISASSVMHERNEVGEQKVVPKPCIVFYVLEERYMPLSENKYPEHLENIPVDVREGDFRFCGAPADQYQDKLCMGCKISSPFKSLTLGGFIEHMEFGLCGITCAHGFFNDNQDITQLKTKQILKVGDFPSFFNTFEPCYTFQPLQQDDCRIGRLVTLILKEGDRNTTGLDLAMFTIENRPLSAVSFPDENGSPRVSMFKTANVLGKLGLPANKPQVFKFGYATKTTVGTVQFDNVVVRENKYTALLQKDKEEATTLYKQYHIKPNDEKFCDSGDSGALVFIEDGQQELRCIGMVVGFLSDNTAVVTPITDILKALGVNSLGSFKPAVLVDVINSGFERMEKTHNAMEKRLLDAIKDINSRP